MAFLGELGAFVKEKEADEKMKPFVAPLGVAAGHLQQASMWFMQNAMAKPDNAGAGATDYMHLFGLVALGFMWCKIVEASLVKLPEANGAAAFYNAKLTTARFFMDRMLPETATRLARIQAGAASTMELPDEAF
jgi:acyl-CoA dehydrogenase